MTQKQKRAMTNHNAQNFDKKAANFQCKYTKLQRVIQTISTPYYGGKFE